MTGPLRARRGGSCAGCGGAIRVGDPIENDAARRWYHAGCKPSRDPAGDRDYWQGRRDVDNWHENQRLFGEEEADRMEIERELREGWDY